ncbi:MAG: hypothetical protein QFX33_04650 [Candidatus Nezhaarchaeota archaeon]|nr:hypothetical protein [Candidatus Nezhaarchaeota archaeon]
MAEYFKVSVKLPSDAYKWLSLAAGDDDVEVEGIVEDALRAIFEFRDLIDEVKKAYSLRGLKDGRCSLSQALAYLLDLGSLLHHIDEHISASLDCEGDYLLSDVKLVEDEPGAYKGVYFMFESRDGTSSIDNFALQVQHDGIYLDATSVSTFVSNKAAREASERLSRAALAIVDSEDFKKVEEEVSSRGGRLNIDVSDNGRKLYLTFMAYAPEISSIPKIPVISSLLEAIYAEAGVKRT